VPAIVTAFTSIHIRSNPNVEESQAPLWASRDNGVTYTALKTVEGGDRDSTYCSCDADVAQGPDGVVYSQSARQPDSLKARIESGDMSSGNVRYVAAVTDLPDATFDLVFTDRNYHDIPEDRVGEVLGQIMNKLKPGGLYVVIDARAAAGRDKEAHRIADDVIVAEVTAAGFELVESSEMLANTDDDHVGADFDSRDTLDRSLLKFRKPAGHGEHGEHGTHEGRSSR